MFLCRKELVIDEKNRITLPAMYRDQFEGSVCYISLAMDNCLSLYPAKEFEKRMERISGLDDWDETARSVQRAMMANTFDLEIDSHNRILLPKTLLDERGITKKIVMVGMGSYLQIWDTEAFDAQKKIDIQELKQNAKGFSVK